MALHPEPVVLVLHSLAAMRQSIEASLRASGWCTQAHQSASDFLRRSFGPIPACLVLDAALADMCGFELQTRLAADWPHVAIVFVAANASPAMAVRAIKSGAVDFLTLPLDDSELLRAVDEAVAHSDGVLRRNAEMRTLGQSYASMSCRERQVMALVTTGLLNKQVGGKLGISEITVKAHRGQVMRKMNARSFPDLVNKAARLKLELKPLRESWGCGWTGATVAAQDRMSLPPRRSSAIDDDRPAELARLAMPADRGGHPRLVACSETNPGA